MAGRFDASRVAAKVASTLSRLRGTPRPPRPQDRLHALYLSHQAPIFASLGLTRPETRFCPSEDVRGEHEIHLVREKTGFAYLYNPRRAEHDQGHFRNATAYLYWLSQSDPNVARISCDISDGGWPGFARFTYSTRTPEKVLLPDFHFFRDHGYADIDAVADTAPDWDSRGDTIYWRGLNNSIGRFSVDPQDIDKPWVMHRMRFALRARAIPDIDVRFVSNHGLRQEAQCVEAGLVGPFRPVADWAGDKFAFDIDGFTNAWSNLMQRLRLGCCVLKIDSEHGFRQWYYDKLVPFETHVPVRADFADLEEKIDWVRSHPREARAIAAHGQAMARAMTFESETRFAAQAIAEHWDRSDGPQSPAGAEAMAPVAPGSARDG
jgi:hypothetical protein